MAKKKSAGKKSSSSSGPSTGILECFPNPSPDREYMIEHIAEEFTSVCPKTGHPDFGVVRLEYCPNETCVELKSYKLYLQAYRNEGIFYEAVTNRIAEDLVTAMEPRYLLLETQWRGRGGIRSTIRVEYRDPAYFAKDEADLAEDFDDDEPLYHDMDPDNPRDADALPPGFRFTDDEEDDDR